MQRPSLWRGKATASSFPGRRGDCGALAAELRGLAGEAEFIRADVRREDDVRNLVDQTVARFGRLDAAVNSAGTEGRPGPVTRQTADSYAATFDTNVLGILLSMKHELRVMQAQRSGSIVNVSSAYGHLGVAGASVYSASKHAVEGPPNRRRSKCAVWRAGQCCRTGPIETGMLNRFTVTAGGKGRARRL